MIKSASVYLSRDGVIRIVTEATTTMGLSVDIEPVYFLKDKDSPEEIGLKALEALNGFQEGPVPHPKNQEERKKGELKWLRSLQITSRRSFLKKGGKVLLLNMEGDTMTIFPTKVKAGRALFLDPTKSACSTKPEEMGQAILAAFDDCE